MLGLGWNEMLVIGIAALIFIGPKDLPVVMNRVGKLVGQIRRMGNEFQREINKTTGLDEVRNLRNAITEPLRKTSEEIRRDFNAMTPKGPQPSGLIKPTNPKVESVVDEIRAQAGMTSVEAPVPPAPPVTTAPAPLVADVPAKPAVAKKPAAKKAPVRAKAAPTRPVITTDLPAVGTDVTEVAEAAPVKKPARKPAAKKAAAPKADATDAPKPAPRKRAPAQPKAAPELPADPETTAKAGSE